MAKTEDRSLNQNANANQASNNENAQVKNQADVAKLVKELKDRMEAFKSQLTGAQLSGEAQTALQEVDGKVQELENKSAQGSNSAV